MPHKSSNYRQLWAFILVLTISFIGTLIPSVGSSAAPNIVDGGPHLVQHSEALDPKALQFGGPYLDDDKFTSTPQVSNQPNGGQAVYRIVITNFGNVTANGVVINDFLPNGFTLAFTSSITLTGGATRTATNNPTAGSRNFSWGTYSIPRNGQIVIIFTANIASTVASGFYNNFTTATSTTPNTNGNPGFELVEVNNTQSQLTLTKTTGTIVQNVGGTFDVPFTITVKNTSTTSAITNFQIVDDLTQAFPSPNTFTLVAAPTLSGGLTAATPAFNGNSQPNLLSGTNTLAANATATASFTVRVTPNGSFGTKTNTAFTNGFRNGDFVTANGSSTANISAGPALTVTKTVGTIVANTGPLAGTYNVPFTIVVSNSGNADLHNVQVTDDLSATFPAPNTFTIVTGPAITGTGGLVLNGGYTGAPAGSINLLNGTGTLLQGRSNTITFTVRVTPATGVSFTNTANGSGLTPANATINATSSIPLTLPENAALTTTKTVGTIVNNADGTYNVPFTIVVNNTGAVTLTNVQVTDDLSSAFAAATTWSILTAPSITGTGGLALNAGYTGTGGVPGINLLTGTGSLINGRSNTITFTVKVTPGATLTGYINKAAGSGTAPSGATISSASNPTITFAENVDVDVDKTRGPIINHGDGTYDVPFTVTISNNGNVNATNVQVTDNLTTAFNGSSGFSVISGPTVTGAATVTANAAYTGTVAGSINLLAAGGTLAKGATSVINFTVRVTPGTKLTGYTNTANSTATGPSGAVDTDSDTSSPTFTENRDIHVNKTTGTITNNGDGTYNVVFTVEIDTGTSDVDLHNVQITDNLTNAFTGSGGFTLVGTPTISGTGSLAVNPAYTGTTAGSINLLTTGGTLKVGLTNTVTITVKVTPGTKLTGYTNSSTATGTSPSNQTTNDTDTSTVTFTEAPAFTATKTTGTIINNGDGTYDVPFTVVVTNTGNVDLHNFQVTDNLTTAFTGSGGFSVISGPTITGTGGLVANNPGFTGTTAGSINLITPAAGGTLAHGTANTITFTVRVTPGTKLTGYTNTAAASGRSPANTLISHSPTSTVTFTESPSMTVVKSIASNVNNGNGTYDVTFNILVTNTGNVDLRNVQVTDNLTTAFAGSGGFSVISAPTVTGTGALTANAGFTGTVAGSINLLPGTDTLAKGTSNTITFTVRVTPGSKLTGYTNSSTATGKSPAGATITPPAGTVPVAFTEAPAMTVAKSVGTIINNGDGTYDVPFQIVVTNTGDVEMRNVQVTDNLTTAFAGSGGFSVISAPTVTGTGALTANAGYTGTVAGSINLLGGTDTLAVGTSNTISFTVRVTPGSKLTGYTNSTTATGTSPSGAVVSPGDSQPVTFTEAPAMTVAKTVGTIINNGDNTYDVPFSIVVTNTGDVELRNVQVTDDLEAAFAGSAGFSIVTPPAITGTGALTANAGYTGTAAGSINLLSGTDTLAKGTSNTITFTVRVTSDGKLTGYSNEADASATSPSTAPVTTSDTTPVTLPQNPKINVTKTAGTVVDNGDGTFEVPMTITVNNPGNVPLTNLQVTDDLTAAFPAPSTFTVVGTPTLSAGLTGPATAFDGNANQNLLSGTDTLAIGDTQTITFTVHVVANGQYGPFTNSATGAGTPPTGSPVTSTGTTGPIVFPQVPKIAITKTAGTIVDNGDGTFDVPMTITVKNTGNVPLSNVQVTDDLTAAFPAPSAFSLVAAPTLSAGLTAATPAFDGNANQNLLSGTDTLAIGDTQNITFTVHVIANGEYGPFTNTATVKVTPLTGPDIGGSDTTPPFSFPQVPTMSVTKTPGTIVDNGDGTFDVPMTITVKNTGNVPLSSLQVTDDLTTAFPAPSTFSLVAAPTLSAGLTAATPAFDGNANKDLLSGTDTLAIGDTQTITFTVHVVANDAYGPFTNSATGTGSAPNGTTTTTTGTTPPFSFPQVPTMDVTKTSGTIVDNGDGTFEVPMTITVKNTGNVPLTNVQVTDDLTAAFPPPSTFNVVGTPALSAGLTGPATPFDGSANKDLLSGTDTLAIGDTQIITFTVHVVANGQYGPFTNSATGTGSAPNGTTTTTTGTTPPFSFPQVPTMSVTKTPGTIVDNGDGTFDVPMTITVKNTGNVPLSNLQVTDDLTAAFPAPSAFNVVGTPALSAGLTGPATPFDGSANKDLLSGTDTLAIGDTQTITFTVHVVANGQYGPFTNSATGTGSAPNGTTTTTTGTTPPFSFPQVPTMSVTKTAGTIVDNGDGSYDVPMTVTVKNTGNVPLSNLQVTDDLTAAFLAPSTFNVVGTPTLSAGLTGPATPFDGNANKDLLSGTDTLAIGDTQTITFTVHVVANGQYGPFTNSATGTGSAPNGTTTTTTGTTPPFSFPQVPTMSVIKTSGTIVDNGDGSYDVPMTISVKNTGNVPLSNLQVTDDLTAAFPPPSTFSLVAAPSLSAGLTAAAPTFDGNANKNLLSGTDTLAIGDTQTITFTVHVVANGQYGPFTNSATGTGSAPNGTTTTTTGTTPPFSFPQVPTMSVIKTSGTIVDNGDGSYDVPMTITVKNTGNVPLSNLQVTDDLTAAFPAPSTFSLVAAPSLSAGLTAAAPTFDGNANKNLLSGTDTLAIGDTQTITFTVHVVANGAYGPFTNSATGTGSAPNGTTTSATGTTPPFSFPQTPTMSVTKAAGTVVDNGDGSYDVPMTISVKNTGNVPLSNLQVTDDLTSAFPAPSTFNVVGTPALSGGLTGPATPFDGNANKNLLSGTDTLAIGDTQTITFTVHVVANGQYGPFTNSATGTGSAPNGTTTSATGTTPPFSFPQVPNIAVTKTAGTVVDNGDGSYDVPMTISVKNTGNVPLTNVQVTDDLTAAFPAPSTFSLVAAPTLSAGLTGPATPFDGNANQNLLSGTDSLAIGDTQTINFSVHVVANGQFGPFTNTANASATPPTGPDVTGSGTTQPITFPQAPSMSVTKTAGTVVDNGDGSYNVPMTITVKNTGNVALTNVQVTDDLTAAFPAPTAFTLVAAPMLSAGLTGPAVAFDGNANQNLLSGTDTLAIGDTQTITFTVHVVANGSFGPFTNTANGKATPPSGPDVTGTGTTQPITFPQAPSMSVTKTAGTVVDNGDGSYNVPMTITVVNTGNVTLTNLQVTDNLTGAFPAPSTFSLVAAPTLSAGLTGPAVAFDGNANQNLLSGTDTLAIGDTQTITFTVRVVANGQFGPFANIANGRATPPSGPDVTGTGTTQPITFPVAPGLSVAKTAGAVVDNGDGTFNIPMTITVTNTGNTALTNVQVTDNLTAAFPAPSTFSLVAAPALSAGLTGPAAAFDGNANQNLLSGADSMAIGATGTITFTVHLVPNGATGPFTNAANAVATPPAGANVTASGSTLPIVLPINPGLNITKTAGAVVDNGNGTYDVPMTIVVNNTGNVALTNLQVSDNLTAAFPAPSTFTLVAAPALSAGLTGPAVAFDGNANQNLLSGADTLAIGATQTITFTVRVTANGQFGPFVNTAAAKGTPPAGPDVTTTGSSMMILFPQTPAMSVAKTAGAVIVNGNGTYDVPMTITVTNTGNAILQNLQVSDNLTAAFPAPSIFALVAAPALSAGLTGPAAAFDGNANQNLLSGTDTLAVGASGTITFTVRVTANGAFGPFVNTANAAAAPTAGPVITASGSTLPIALPVPTNTPTATPTNTPTNTPVGPTNTPTDTPTNTPTNTPTDTPTNTPVGPTNTPTDTPVGPTNTPTNTPTDPPTNTPTNTPVGPTDTPTNTPVGPTATPTHTPTNTPKAGGGGVGGAGKTPTPTPQTVAVGAVANSQNALIEKTANTQIAAPGSPVTFTITVKNPGPGSLTNVKVVDSVPSEFIINSINTTKGTYNVSGNAITFLLGTLSANQQVTMTIATTVSSSVQPPDTATNTANLSDDQGQDPSSSVTVRITRGLLPSTGEHPDPEKPLLPVVMIVVVVSLFFFGRRWKKFEVRW